ncbi:hypothetical protein DPSP01_004575 [Paraphaeosphaeria sporulosa]
MIAIYDQIHYSWLRKGPARFAGLKLLPRSCSAAGLQSQQPKTDRRDCRHNNRNYARLHKQLHNSSSQAEAGKVREGDPALDVVEWIRLSFHHGEGGCRGRTYGSQAAICRCVVKARIFCKNKSATLALWMKKQ